jgi:flagellar hook assembly protein FlgD
MNIRFVTNRSDITEDNVKIRIYDVAGHRVRTIDTPPRKIGTTYDFRWDMLNGKGKRVANGVYFAKVEIRDPNNPAIKFKTTLKLAVLR